MDLEVSRNRIDQIDKSLTMLFEERMQMAGEIANYKKENGLPVFNNNREQEVLEKTFATLNNKELEGDLRKFYLYLMNLSKDYQQQMLNESIVVGYAGVEGAYASLAVRNFFGNDDSHQTKKYQDFGEIFQALDNREITYGVVPINNTSTGSINQNYDLLNQHDCFILGETQVKAEHNLLANQETKLSDIQQVYSHPQGFEQSSAFLGGHPEWELVPYHNTAISAKYISEMGNPHMAAIASKEAAGLYGLKILVEDVANNKRNFTRFLKIGRRPTPSPDCNKITVIFAVKHAPGSLYQALQTVSSFGINMLHLESRPIQNRPWEYFFYLDLEGNDEDPVVKHALAKLKENTSYFKYLGNYPREVY